MTLEKPKVMNAIRFNRVTTEDGEDIVLTFKNIQFDRELRLAFRTLGKFAHEYAKAARNLEPGTIVYDGEEEEETVDV